ncbi:MAG: T9SS type A sorting domain-containing protein [Chitinophagaceae bacterium]
MSINNTTGSVRTAFAFFGTLVKTNPNGTTQRSYLSGCGGKLAPNVITTVVVNSSITYNCNQTLSLVDVFLAWTDASGSNDPNGTAIRCDEILNDACVHIAPKCGTAPVIPIAPLLSLSSTTTSGCTGASAGKIRITPIGGRSNYSVTLKKGSATIATQNNVTASGYEFTGLVEGTDYSAVVTDAATPTACTYTSGAIALGSVFCCTPPSIATNPSPVGKCTGLSASFTASASGGDPIPTVQWQAKAPAGNFGDLSNTGVYTNVTTETLNISNVAGLNGYKYRAVFTSTGCTPAPSNDATLTVNALPNPPTVAYTAPLCDQNTFSLTIGSVGNPILFGAKYTVVNKNGQPITGISPSASPYIATAQNVSDNQIIFSGIPAGSGYSVTIESSSGCVPSAAALPCGQPDPPPPPGRPAITSPSEEVFTAQTTVKAYPNPFSDRIKFVINSPEAGYGSLDVMNMLGQKVKTIYQGRMNAGVQTFEMVLPQNRTQTLVYILRINEKQVTGKLLQRN